MISVRLAQLHVDILALEKQQEASYAMLSAAMLAGNAADLKHLRAHAHTLLDQLIDKRVAMYDELKRQMRF